MNKSKAKVKAKAKVDKVVSYCYKGYSYDWNSFFILHCNLQILIYNVYIEYIEFLDTFQSSKTFT